MRLLVRAAVDLLKMAGVKSKEAGDSVGGNPTITTIEKKLDGKNDSEDPR